METKRCPYCSEEILVEAKKCKFCGEFLDKELSTERAKIEEGSKQIVVTQKSSGLMTFLIILAIIALIVFLTGI
ncbi:hypothetical protein [Algoriphagus aquimarinus]|uniref:hypothetical protein n=1 Tax=Algoriphagus aquimarinus TaxID=237018 RepID=UPI0030DC56CD|tara:strand:- start:394 stop:615 length:222 start_codon:yes stop_codon:yes gene_type:complete